MELKIGSAIKKLRVSKNVTQEQLAEYLNVSFQAVSKWETGVTVPDVALLPKMAMFFGVSIDALFAVDDDEKIARVEKSLVHEKMTEESFAYAHKVLAEILAEDENNARVLNLLAEVFKNYDEMKMHVAAGYACRAIEADPADVNGYVTLWFAKNATSRNPDEDMYAHCEANALAYPELELLQLRMAEICVRLRRFEQLEKFTANLDESVQIVFRGDVALAHGRVDEAYALWEKAAEMRGLAGYLVGKRFERCQEIDKAIHVYEMQFEHQHQPRHLDSVYALAYLYERLGRPEKAIAMWQRIIDVTASDWKTTDGEMIDKCRCEIGKLQGK